MSGITYHQASELIRSIHDMNNTIKELSDGLMNTQKDIVRSCEHIANMTGPRAEPRTEPLEVNEREIIANLSKENEEYKSIINSIKEDVIKVKNEYIGIKDLYVRTESRLKQVNNECKLLREANESLAIECERVNNLYNNLLSKNAVLEDMNSKRDMLIVALGKENEICKKLNEELEEKIKSLTSYYDRYQSLKDIIEKYINDE